MVHHKIGEDFWPRCALNVVRELVAPDEEQTWWEEPEGEDRRPIIFREALRSELVRGEGTPMIFVSGRLKRALERVGAARGVHFIRVPAF
ncbi:hypothetical protein [Thermoflexus sp.]|uniref:hypothetical protein n=1 Tax=Thermoflexus sp. TaxID=1969742 RepID=UPI0025EDADBA|nr:hypothetical protein [Thermoflexus sp.]